jgi:hypothetical protein
MPFVPNSPSTSAAVSPDVPTPKALRFHEERQAATLAPRESYQPSDAGSTADSEIVARTHSQ